jgi:hypothetical protein
MVTFFLNNKCFYSFKIGYAHIIAMAAVPAFPGATKEYHKVDSESFSSKACSPPEPNSKIVMCSCV